jgi:microcystin-dependent protein
MSCNGCFNGCVDITSDQCVKYTGDPIVAFGIETGMPMSEVTEKITEYLLEVLEGTGVEPTLPAVICDLVHDYLPEGDATLNDVIEALINAACDLQTQVDGLSTILDGIEASYTIGCLTGVTAASGTHNILQAVITKLCFVADQVTALQAALSQYQKIADLCDDVADCIALTNSTKYYHKMIPYTAVEYYGPTDNFNINGVGQGDWEQIYLCNGLNGTPDKKGRLPVGATTMGGTFNNTINPNPPFSNPAYTVPSFSLPDVNGSNTVVLTHATIPAHLHLATSTVVDNGHHHVFCGTGGVGVYSVKGSRIGIATTSGGNTVTDYYTNKTDGTINLQTTGVTVSTQLDPLGGGLAHNNIPPVMATYYIMFIPTP